MPPSPPSSSVAGLLEPAVERLLGQRLPFRLEAWDGSTAGPSNAPVTVVVHHPDALRHLLWAPGELGLARAHVSGLLDIEGDVFTFLGIRDQLGSPTDHVGLRFDLAGWVHLARAAARLGVIGRRPPLPDAARAGRA